MKRWAKWLIGTCLLYVPIWFWVLSSFPEFSPNNVPTSGWLFMATVPAVVCLVIFSIFYIQGRRDLPTYARAAWTVGILVFHPIAVPLLYYFYILPHPSDRPVIDPWKRGTDFSITSAPSSATDRTLVDQSSQGRAQHSDTATLLSTLGSTAYFLAGLS